MSTLRKLSLLCIPYSGGTTAVFNGWKEALGPEIDVITYEYPRFRKRLGNPAKDMHLDDLVDEVVAVLKPINTPYAILGHSMGAALAYLAAKKIESSSNQLCHVFLSGFEPPHVYFSSQRETYKLSDEDFGAALRAMGNIPDYLSNNLRALFLFLPALRNDFCMLESYQFCYDNHTLNSEVSVFLGHDDPVTKHVDKSKWKNYSNVKTSMREFEGDHFFIERSKEAVIEAVATVLQSKFPVSLVSKDGE